MHPQERMAIAHQHLRPTKANDREEMSCQGVQEKETRCAYLADMYFNIIDRAAFDRFRRLDNCSQDEDDALIRETSGPLDHLFADLFITDGKHGLDCVGPLTKIEENHFISLKA